ncbi:Trp biosynthesis-associated membrane protein [Leucobacter sp. M11]|uniref:Trp biosynthesis-associated membrane protein n=1 Tax=Leucobacter sp. M11 TaxID=2993565 RepID=UPI002D80201E|nr:Trp biosynthesis-associated membrane protein [Leucobacter sp. M11]MEB4616263.1 Trp biosynthesis-associated membrane protein [Leucobacter sp. M11]
MTGAKRLKRVSLLLLLVSAGAALFGTTQTWYTLELAEGAASVDEAVLTGQQASAGLSSFGLAALALTVALTIAGPVFRVILGLLAVGFGAGVLSLSLGVMSSPRTAALDVLAELTGLAGEEASYGTVTSIAVTPWPAVTATAGVVLGLIGLLVVVTGHRWPRGGRKYDTSAANSPAVAGAAQEPDRISDWDQLSGGGDPSADGSAEDEPAEAGPGRLADEGAEAPVAPEAPEASGGSHEDPPTR